MRKFIKKLRFALAKKIGGAALKQLGPTSSIKGHATLGYAQLRPIVAQVPKADPYRHDKLNRSEFGTAVCRLLSYGTNTGVIFIDGVWGTGKSTFLKMLAKQIRNDGQEGERSIVIEINAWENDAFREPIEYIADKMLEGLKEHKATIFPKDKFKRLGIKTLAIVPGATMLASGLPIQGIEPLISNLKALTEIIKLLSKVEKEKSSHDQALKKLKRNLAEKAKKLWGNRRPDS